MLSGLFNYDNPVWRFIGKFADIILLNLLWIICSIPIFTIGASTTAVYYVTLKMARDEDGYTIRGFFKSFRENFRQATVIWLIMLVAAAVIGGDLYILIYVYQASTFRNIMVSIFGAMLILYVAVGSYIFPVQARFYNSVKRTFFNAFFISIRHIAITITMVAMDVALIILPLFVAQLFPLFLLFGLPLIAFANSFLLNAVFKRYIPEEEKREMRPIFADEEEAEEKREEINKAEADSAEDQQGESK